MPLKKLLEITIFSVGEIQCWRSTVTTVDPQRADLLRLKFYKFEKFFEGIKKEWAEHFRPVRQRTVRSQTTKDKPGALPPAVYEKAKSGTWSGVSFPDGCMESSKCFSF